MLIKNLQTILAAVLILFAFLGGAPAEAQNVVFNVGTLPAGASITMTFEVDIDDPLPPGMLQLIAQGVITASGYPAIATDDPDTATPDDPTITQLFLPPVANCMNVMAQDDGSGMTVVMPEEVDNGSFDPDGGPVTFSLDPPGPFMVGMTPVILTVTDDETDSATCEATINILAATPTPTLTATVTPLVPTQTATETPTVTQPEATQTATETPTITQPEATQTATETPTVTQSGPTETPTETSTPGGPTETPTETSTPGGPTETPTETSTPGGPTETPTETSTPGGPTETITPTNTPGGPTETPTETNTPGGPTETATATNTPSGPTETPTATPTGTRTLAPGEDCDGGYYVLDSFGGRHRVGNVVVINGPLYFGNDIARDMERLLCQPVTGGPARDDLYVLDGFGGTHIVQNQTCEIMQEFYFGEVPGIPEGRAVDLEMTVDYQGFWVLADHGGIYRAGSAKDGGDPALLAGTSSGMLGYDVPITGGMRDPNLPDPGGASLRAVSLVVIDEDLNSRADGYIVLDSMGGRFHFNPDGSPVSEGSSAGQPVNDPSILLDPMGYIWPFFPGLDIARDMELFPSQQGVVILDGWDGIHPVPVDVESNPVFFANNVVSASDSTPLQSVGMPYVVGGFDDPDTMGTDEGDETTYGIDAASIFTDLEFSVGCSDGLYTLDSFGGVFVLGAARPNLTEPVPQYGNSPYFFPFLYAEDMEIFPRNES